MEVIRKAHRGSAPIVAEPRRIGGVKRLHWLLAVGATLTMACGGGSDTPDLSPTTDPATATAAMPDGCTLLSNEDASAAVGVAGVEGTSPQPATDVSTRCEWQSGQYSVSLLVRQGPTAQASFDNTADGFTAITIPDAEAKTRLGAREPSRNYRLVAISAFDGSSYVYISLQGPDRDDAASQEVLVSLANSVFARLE